MDSIGHPNCKRLMKDKHPCCTKLFAFRCLRKGFTGLKYFTIWVRCTSFSKTTLLQRELFITMCDTINSSCSLPSKILCQQWFWVLPINSVELTRAVKKNIRFFNNLFPKIYTIISAAKIITTAARNSIQNINLWRKKATQVWCVCKNCKYESRRVWICHSNPWGRFMEKYVPQK